MQDHSSGATLSLGTFNTAVEAAAAFDEALFRSVGYDCLSNFGLEHLLQSCNVVSVIMSFRLVILRYQDVHALKGLALPRASHSGEIALAGSRHLRSTLAAAPVLFAHAAITVGKTSSSAPLPCARVRAKALACCARRPASSLVFHACSCSRSLLSQYRWGT